MSKAYTLAQEEFARFGVDTEKVLKRLDAMPLSIHCWQGDDVSGFENSAAVDGGLAVTGSYPGRARNADELRQDIDLAFTLIPGIKRLSLHAIYAEFGKKKVGRDEIGPDQFKNWMAWSKATKTALDFNPSCFSHPKMKDGLTLSSPDASVRKFWIEHGIRCREIAEAFGKAQKCPCVTNFWVPDGFKDTPADRLAPRQRLADSLDKIFAKPISEKYDIDCVESKLFGIGAESCTVGSHEFYFGYALKNGKTLTLDAGHFHPTEVISDKISSTLLYFDKLLLHVSRGVRWDSDHVVTFTDELRAIAEEIVSHNFDKRVFVALDYFDASINRIAAWVIGARNMKKALLTAMLQPALALKAEKAGDQTGRLAAQEDAKFLPVGAVWQEYCERSGVAGDFVWMDTVRSYEKKVLAKRK